MVLVNENKQVIKINPAFKKKTRYKEIDLRNKPIHSIHLPQSDYLPLPSSTDSTFEENHEREIILKLKNGNLKRLRLETVPLHRTKTVSYYAYIYKEIHPLAYQDPLTSLPNRRCFENCLYKSFMQKADREKDAAILFVDLDRFKFINDTLGHKYGDKLLQMSAQRMKAVLRNKDIVARLGGDEFVCLLPDIITKRETEEIANRILKTLSKPFHLFNQEIRITASIGISLYPLDGDDPESLITNADIAMYRAKQHGKNQIKWFKAEDHARGYEKFVLENHLRKALCHNQFSLVYQPQIDLQQDEISGVEALIRWDHPDLGLISPNDFIPLAEETGLIMEIGEWVLKEACRQNKEWQDRGYKPLKIAVNLSAVQLTQGDLPETIRLILQEIGLEPKWLEVEITESMIFQNVDGAIRILHQLKDMGLHISIDDFGTGYSSLSYLVKLPIDILKIDRSFIKEIETNRKLPLVTSSIITMAHSMDMKVIAEGVETVGQLQEMTNQACDTVQGYIFSKPLIPAKLEKLLQELN
ncbi:diguanylate cyclase (GGDEF)-like protein [Bacillus benzoevorans]|uniref:Diguanylate cyclase (GGDEF)-like protein n=2 Tax=Bacillus benzoevorans TaxID=1456 RepID=A0A7X0HQW8_9BACI|nr:diguanylate cyclase (GGDEF)-like protein [Bacillus benzoevorans]